MENITIGILTESYVISRGIQFIISKNNGLSSHIIPNSELCIKNNIIENNINLLIVSDNVFEEPKLLKLYKTDRNLNFGLIRTKQVSLNSMFEFKIDFDLFDTEGIIKSKLDKYLESALNSNKLSLEDSELSKREIEILRLVALGKTNQAIAETLFISKHTVVTHRKKITAKLGIKTISGLTVYALLNSIIETNEIDELN